MNPFYAPSGGSNATSQVEKGGPRNVASPDIQMMPSYLHPDRQRKLFLPIEDTFDSTILQLQRQQAQENEFKLTDLAIPAGLAVLTTTALVATHSPLVVDYESSSTEQKNDTSSSLQQSSSNDTMTTTKTTQQTTDNQNENKSQSRTNLVKFALCTAGTTAAIYGFHRFVLKPHILPRLKSWMPGSSSSSSTPSSIPTGSFAFPY